MADAITQRPSNSAFTHTIEKGQNKYTQKDDGDASTKEITILEDAPNHFVFIDQSTNQRIGQGNWDDVKTYVGDHGGCTEAVGASKNPAGKRANTPWQQVDGGYRQANDNQNTEKIFIQRRDDGQHYDFKDETGRIIEHGATQARVDQYIRDNGGLAPVSNEAGKDRLGNTGSVDASIPQSNGKSWTKTTSGDEITWKQDGKDGQVLRSNKKGDTYTLYDGNGNPLPGSMSPEAADEYINKNGGKSSNGGSRSKVDKTKIPQEDEPLSTEESAELDKILQEESGGRAKYTRHTGAVTPETFTGGSWRTACNGKVIITPNNHVITNRDPVQWKEAKKSMHTWEVANNPNSFGMGYKGNWGERNKDVITDREGKIPKIKDPAKDIYSSPELKKSGVICYVDENGKKHVVLKDYPTDNPAYKYLSEQYEKHHGKTKSSDATPDEEVKSPSEDVPTDPQNTIPAEDEPLNTEESAELSKLEKERVGGGGGRGGSSGRLKYTRHTGAVTPETFAGGSWQTKCNGKVIITPSGHIITNQDPVQWKEAKKSLRAWEVANNPNSFGMGYKGNWGERNKDVITDREGKIPKIKDPSKDIYSSPELQKSGVICYIDENGKKHVVLENYPVGNSAYKYLLEEYKKNHSDKS